MTDGGVVGGVVGGVTDHNCSARCAADHDEPFKKQDTASGRFFKPRGARIRQRREAAGLLAVELARQAGISKSYLSEIESGHTVWPSADVLYRIAAILNTTMPDLMGLPEQVARDQ